MKSRFSIPCFGTQTPLVKLLALAVVFFAPACSDDDNQGAAAPQCHKMVSRLCDKLAACQGNTKAECVDAMNQTYIHAYRQSCDGAARVSGTYDQCMIDIENYVCGDPQPPNCKSAIVFD